MRGVQPLCTPQQVGLPRALILRWSRHPHLNGSTHRAAAPLRQRVLQGVTGCSGNHLCHRKKSLSSGFVGLRERRTCDCKAHFLRDTNAQGLRVSRVCAEARGCATSPRTCSCRPWTCRPLFTGHRVCPRRGRPALPKFKLYRCLYECISLWT